ncbi:uncharacterized protein LOC130949101 [Arachis stenosperma]|uniref:uncharacterized protein LOC130949101 n=1 Tax=Arachis stenosperma TaxID=217475 RepID=UPI0025AC9E0F|nr:uncharacterized protein LOC130949101 [Arachis stenosperma]
MNKAIALVASSFLILLLASPTVFATDYTVGDASGWTLEVDYTKWVAGKEFKVGDTLRSDQDMHVLFHCQQSFPEVRIYELFAKLEHGIDSSWASAPNPLSTIMGGASTSMSVIAPDCLLANRPSGAIGVVTSSRPIPNIGCEGEPNRAKMRCERMIRMKSLLTSVGTVIMIFQQIQQHVSKEEAVLSVKDYSICRGIEYKLIEPDHLQYHERCKEFGKGCMWMIHITLQQRKSTWEVRQYNGPHTCLATSISSDHRQLDYHAIYAKIFPLVRANAAVSIKVLQEATEATYGFRPSYRKAWMAKQKAVAQIYGD